MTRWSRFDVTFEGVHWSAIEPLVKPLPSAHYVVAHAEEGYTANVPIAFLRDPLSLLATHADGEPLTPEHGGPLRLVIPRQVLLEEREVATRHRAHRERPPRLLGALRLPQRRRPVRRRSGTASEGLRDSPRKGEDRRRQIDDNLGTQSSPVLPPLSGRPSGHSSFRGTRVGIAALHGTTNGPANSRPLRGGSGKGLPV